MDNFIPIFSSDECAERGGSVNGECALGYGVCCICKYTYLFLYPKSYLYWFKAFKMASKSHQLGLIL